MPKLVLEITGELEGIADAALSCDGTRVGNMVLYKGKHLKETFEALRRAGFVIVISDYMKKKPAAK